MTTPGTSSRSTLLTRLRPYFDQVSGLRAALLTLGALLRSGRREVWIGDSHAAAYVVGPTWANFLTGPRGEIIVRAGARLMYSLARRGFPARVTRFATLVGRFGRADSVAPIFVAGEIDVRNALPAHPAGDYGFVADYVRVVGDLATRMKASRAYLLTPPPPRPAVELAAGYPHVGSDAERVAVFDRLREELAAATADRADVILIDLTDVLAGEDGMMRPEFTDDGCHPNAAAHPVIRAALAAHPAFDTGQR